MKEWKPIKIHMREALLINQKSLTPDLVDKIKAKYELRFYEDKACASCEYLPERHCDICDNCAAFKGGVALAKDLKIGKKKYLSSPLGDSRGLRKILEEEGIEEFKVKKHFPNQEMSKSIKFTGSYKAGQKEAVKAIIKKKRGILRAPPRSGKTVMGASAIAKIGKKAIIMASQRDWLKGFLETFIGSKTQKALTNISKKKIGYAKTLADFKKYDICLVTVQTFYSEKGQKLLEKIRDMFPVVMCDEVHTASANKYAGVLARLNCEYKIGLSGTPARKDGRHAIGAALIGPIIYNMKVPRLRPTVRLVRTQYKRTYKGQVPWTSMVSSLEKDPARLKLIAQWALKDVEDGHMVLIPFSQVTPIRALILAINKMAGKTLAYPFYGGVPKLDRGSIPGRDTTIDLARDYKIKILVGNTKLLSTGINIPRASMLYEVSMSSNVPNCEQRISRILTPWDDKPPPMVRMFLDDMNVRKNCLRNEWFQCIKPKFNPIISEKDEQILKGYLSSKDRGLLEGSSYPF